MTTALERSWHGLRPHQHLAATRAVGALAGGGRAQVVMPCGTGKTRVGIAVATGVRARLVLVTVPTLSLLRQTAAAWQELLGTQLQVLFACSDPSIAVADTTQTTPEAVSVQLGAPVTTDVEILADRLRGRGQVGEALTVAFSTYASLPRVLQAAVASGATFDLVVADEAHHCAGDWDTPWSALARHGARDHARIRRRLFLTATPRLRQPDATSRDRGASMDDHAAFGEVVYRLSLGEAIRGGLLSDYRVAAIGVSDAQWRGLARAGAPHRNTARAPIVLARGEGHRATIPPTMLAASFALGQAMGHYPLRRILTFHARVRDAKAYASAVPHLLRRVTHPGIPRTITATATHASLPAAARATVLDQFDKANHDHAVIATNVRCLSEGVDIPALDAVVFADPRRGLVDIVQAVGRVMRPHPDKTAGTVILPVLLSSAGSVAAHDTARFADVIHVLQVLREHDTELAAQLDEMRRDAGRHGERWRGLSSTVAPGPLRLLLPHGLPDSFVRAFSLRLLEGTTSPWEERFGTLQAWAERHQHSRVPTSCVVDGFRMGGWVHEQRSLRARGLLPQTRAARLESLPGWTWTPWAAAWERAFGLLQQFVDEHGHSKVPQTHRREGFALGSWVKAQRELHQKGRLPSARTQRLEQLPGWYWRQCQADASRQQIASLPKSPTGRPSS